MSERHALKQGREKCYQARDSFYQCMRASGAVYTSGQSIPSSCAKLRKAYEASCLASWVSTRARVPPVLSPPARLPIARAMRPLPTPRACRSSTLTSSRSSRPG
jgi:hypothetical protein